jgi:hypothetical protein
LINLLIQLLNLSIKSILRVRNIWNNNILLMIINLNGRERVRTHKYIFIFWVISLFKHYLTLLSCDVVENRLYFSHVAVAWMWICFPFFIYLIDWIVVFHKVFTVFNITFYQHFCKNWTSLLFNFTVICSLRVLCVSKKSLLNIIYLICFSFINMLW